MITLPLQAIPNQSFTFSEADFRFEVTIKEAAGVMAVDISVDNSIIIQGQKVVSGGPVIPYRHLESGNFAFITENDEIPYYDQFGVSQSLIYLTPDDLGGVRD